MKKKITSLLTITTLLGTCLTYAPAALSQQTAEDKIKFRQSGFMFMRWNMGIIKKHVIKNPEAFNQEKVLAAAEVLAAIAKSNIQTLFTPATKTGKGWKNTRVKPDYFNNEKKVNQYTLDLIKETELLVAVSNEDDIGEIKNQFKKVLNTCKGCHKSFRMKN